jgi:cell volume regulation protein A
MHEPAATAVLLAVFGALLVVSVVFSRAAGRFPVPAALLFLAIGMMAGSEGIGGIAFEDYGFAFRLGTVALVLILFDGGLNTPIGAVRRAAGPAGMLAVAGVLGTAGLTAAAAHWLGLAWGQALLLGAIVSSTDAAAVFSVLRGSGIQLERRVGTTLEVESGINDPMAVILTTAMTRHLLSPGHGGAWSIAAEVVVELAVGGVLGVLIGWGGRLLLDRLRLPVSGLYPAFTLGLACIAYSVPTLLHGSGFLAVYLAAVLIGDARLPFRPGLRRVHDALAWLSQIVMFLLLGLLAFPSRLREVAGVGLALALFLAFVARPAVVAACLAPFRAFRAREVAYVGWVGLRGAVPIILATVPVLAGAPGAKTVFDIAFFVVVINALVPGATVPWVTRRLRLESDAPPPPRAVLEIESMQPLEGELRSYYVEEELAAAGVPLRDLPFPDGSAAVMVVRGRQVLAAKGDTVLAPGDHVYVLARPDDLPTLHLLFGRPEGEDE